VGFAVAGHALRDVRCHGRQAGGAMCWCACPAPPGNCGIWGLRKRKRTGFRRCPRARRCRFPLPASLASPLAVFGPLFTAPVVPYLLRPGLRGPCSDQKATVCGMLAGAGLSRLWSHDRAHSLSPRPVSGANHGGEVAIFSIDSFAVVRLGGHL
jgi:hypothetical protein